MRISYWSSDVCSSDLALPVPLPLPTSFGGKESYIDQLSVQLKSCDPRMLFYPAELADMAGDAARACGVEGRAYEDFLALQPHQSPLPQARTDEICYLQYSQTGRTHVRTPVPNANTT